MRASNSAFSGWPRNTGTAPARGVPPSTGSGNSKTYHESVTSTLAGRCSRYRRPRSPPMPRLWRSWQARSVRVRVRQILARPRGLRGPQRHSLCLVRDEAGQLSGHFADGCAPDLITCVFATVHRGSTCTHVDRRLHSVRWRRSSSGHGSHRRLLLGMIIAAYPVLWTQRHGVTGKHHERRRISVRATSLSSACRFVSSPRPDHFSLRAPDNINGVRLRL